MPAALVKYHQAPRFLKYRENSLVLTRKPHTQNPEPPLNFAVLYAPKNHWELKTLISLCSTASLA